MKIFDEINSLKSDASIGFVSGVFNVLHTGHLRIINFAKKKCDILVVFVLPDTTPGSVTSCQERLENISNISAVDYCFSTKIPLTRVLSRLKPDFVFKGSEFKTKNNVEESIVKTYGGQLVFSSGSSYHVTDTLLNEKTRANPQKIASDYLDRHNIKESHVLETINNFATKNLLVIGDLILDKYTTCDPIGISREDPIIVMSPTQDATYIGGAAIVASHAARLGANVTYLSVVGDDEHTSFCIQKLKDYGVKAKLWKDENRRTTLKHRYRSGDKTVFRLNYLDAHDISNNFSDQMVDYIEHRIKDFDAIIFSDFNYGCLPQSLIDKVVTIAKKRNVNLFADSQTSSQLGDISRYRDMTMISPTEHEIRVSFKNTDSGLVSLAEQMLKDLRCQHAIITLGADGLLIHSPKIPNGEATTDKIPALNTNPKDVAGSGDVFLVSTALALCCGTTIWLAAYIGAISSGVHVSTVGNEPIDAAKIRSFLGK